ncbi:MAG: formylglycine-generating enzyme family protein [Vicinamibacteraceae bacterium]
MRASVFRGALLVGLWMSSLGSDGEVVRPVQQKGVESVDAQDAAAMKRYTESIPGSNGTCEMVPIRGGLFQIGSPADEAGRSPDEGPQRQVRIEPFWMGSHEITWDEYDLFTFPVDAVEASGGAADAVSRPTKPYVDMSFGMGHSGFPAISMTQHAASKYCEWLSAKTGRFYRLPTEAEWEYAARAGTETAYSFSGDPADLDRHAWYSGNSEGKYHSVGSKEPNPWDLYDMHGNVMEWTLDQYVPDRYRTILDGSINPWLKALRPYPHVVRGGSWADEPPALRSAARRGSDPSWKMQDPQLPKSVWYHTDAPWVGFRIVRPLKVPSAKEQEAYWHTVEQ